MATPGAETAPNCPEIPQQQGECLSKAADVSSAAMSSWRVRALACALVLGTAAAAAKTPRKGQSKKQTAKAAKPIYGPPAPTPSPFLRAAGSCLSYEPGQFLLLAEVGQQGRVFKIGSETVLHVEPRRGARIRLLYLETPDGPVAREVLPGPIPDE
jgi:hypothetical protein